MSACEISAGLVLLQMREAKATDVELAETTTQARDTCESVRDKLLLADTDHFDDEAAIGFHGIDRYKSGLNAVLAYLDNPRPTKIVEIRNKIREGDRRPVRLTVRLISVDASTGCDGTTPKNLFSAPLRSPCRSMERARSNVVPWKTRIRPSSVRITGASANSRCLLPWFMESSRGSGARSPPRIVARGLAARLIAGRLVAAPRDARQCPGSVRCDPQPPPATSG